MLYRVADEVPGRGGSGALRSAGKRVQSRGVQLAGAGLRGPFVSGRRPVHRGVSVGSHRRNQATEAPRDFRRERGMVLTLRPTAGRLQCHGRERETVTSPSLWSTLQACRLH